MHRAGLTLIAALTKHDEAGIAAIAIAVVLVVVGGLRLAVKAVAFTLFLVAFVAAVIGILLLTRVI